MERARDTLNKGREVPDPIPMAPALGYERRPTIRDQIRDMIQSEKLKEEVTNAGAETFDEANDFDVEDEYYDPTTPYEDNFDPEPAPDETARYVSDLKAELAKYEPENSQAPAGDPPKPEPNPATTEPNGTTDWPKVIQQMQAELAAAQQPPAE